MLTWQEAEEMYGPLLNISQTQDYAKIAYNTINACIENGLLNGCYLRVGIDVSVEDLPKRRRSRLTYVFIRAKIDEFRSKYKSLAAISREVNVPVYLLEAWGKRGLWEPIAGISRLWDVEEVKAKLFPQQVKLEDFLNERQIALIDAFIAHRKKGRPIKFHGKSFKTGFPNEERVKDLRSKLIRIFYRIICGRSGIVGFGEIVAGGTYRLLSEEEKPKYNPDLFEVRTFCRTDLDYIEDGLGDIAAFQMCKELTPFLYWFLKEEELKPENDEQYTPEFQAMVNRFMRAIDLFPDKQPTPNESREKVFLTREQVVRIYLEILKSNVRDPLKAATQFMIGCLLGLRPPSEYWKIRIEYFELDHAGYLKTDTNGYGKLRLPKHATKGGYSQSHKRYGTLVVPLLVKLINRYLSNLYELYPEGRGKGFLFRPDPRDTDRRYHQGDDVETWVAYTRELTHITQDVERIIAYDTRHTINNIIVETVLPDPALAKAQERAAEIQVRHNMDEETGGRKFGSTGNVHYRKDIPEDVYRKVIDQTLNYPWDLEDLKCWESERGYRDASEYTTVQPPSSSVQPSLPASEMTEEEKATNELLLQYEAEYADLSRGRPKSMKMKTWMERLDWLQAQISQLEIAVSRKF